MATFTNVATLSYNGTVVNSNVTTGEIQQTLAATKHSLANTYKQGDTLTYIVNIVNTGNTAFTNLTLTDNLGGYTYGAGTVYPSGIRRRYTLLYQRRIADSSCRNSRSAYDNNGNKRSCKL